MQVEDYLAAATIAAEIIALIRNICFSNLNKTALTNLKPMTMRTLTTERTATVTLFQVIRAKVKR